MFRINPAGFTLTIGNQIHEIAWTDIERLILYRVDLLTFDEICLDIVLSETFITITEEIPGWWDFMDLVEVEFPVAKDPWAKFWISPAFNSAVVTIYQRNV